MNHKVWLDVGIFGKLYNGAESKFLVCCSQIKSVFGSRWKRSETNSSLEKKSMPQCRGTCGLTRWWLWQIHGCMDGWSRKLLWLLVTCPDTCLVDIASYYLDAVEQYSGCRAWYWFRKRERNNGYYSGFLSWWWKYSALVSSLRIQRIEGYWSFNRRNNSTWLINFFFEVLIHENHRNTCDPLKTEHLWLSFLELKKIRIKQENTGTLIWKSTV